MANPKDNFIASAVKAKNSVVGGAKGVASQVQKNIKQGQADFESGKMPYYGTTNPLKGAIQAYRTGSGG